MIVPYPSILFLATVRNHITYQHELPGLPEIPIHGDYTHLSRSSSDKNSESRRTTINVVVGLQIPGVRRGRYNFVDDTVKLYDGARQVLYELATNSIYKDIQFATASSSLEPDYSYACLQNIEILPYKTMHDMMICNQIGRTGKLTPNKITHFQQIHADTGIPFKEMLFFDDCNWGDHCSNVTKNLGVISWRTPQGLTFEDFLKALDKYHNYHSDSKKCPK